MRHYIPYESEVDGVLRQALEQFSIDEFRNALVIVMPDRYRYRRI